MEKGGRRAMPEPGLESPLHAALAARDASILSMVEAAIAARRLTLAFQPVVQAGTGHRLAFHEALLRILDPSGRTIPAAEFIDAAESRETGRRLDCIALQAGLGALRRWPGLRLAVNMSARSIGYAPWMAILDRTLRADPTIGERLILEITETSAMMMPDVVLAFMSGLRARGVSFALDDFGAGYTAFRHLRDFCFDIVKIDGQFVRRIDRDPDNEVLVAALVSVARHFDMFTVAERVETPAEAARLAALGVDCLQGYLFGVPATEPWVSTAASRISA